MSKSYIKIPPQSLFPPFPIQADAQGFEKWGKSSNKKWTYAPNGRAAIFHITRALGVRKILLSSYLCASVLEGLRAAGAQYDFLDVEPNRVVPSIEELKRKLSNGNFDAVLWASLYGQASKLHEVEDLCRTLGVQLIDDAAQSFGALESGRRVGEFGNAGLISFAPGKATAGPFGAFFWVDADYKFSEKSHPLFHRLKAWDFFFNRYYSKKWPVLPWVLSKAASFFTRRNFYYFDKYEKFEWPILGGIISRELDPATLQLRRERFLALDTILGTDPRLEVYKPNIEESNPHKQVVIFLKAADAKIFKKTLLAAGIPTGHGYTTLSESCGNSKALWGRVVELPIFPDKERADFLESIIKRLIRD